MIKNRKQYSILKKQLEMLEKEIEKKSTTELETLPFKERLQLDVFRGQCFEIQEEISEYEKLISSREPINFNNIKDLSKAIISARILSGLSQNDLADKLGIQQQQIQRYEMDDYDKTSLERIIQICEILGLKAKFIVHPQEFPLGLEKKIDFLLPKDVQISNLNTALKIMQTNCSLLN